MKLGQKIKNYRTSKKMSQLELELEIETSPGRISKIENGIINPDKETLIKIAYALKLDTTEIASLFGISLPNYTEIFETVNEILLSKDRNFIIDKTINELVFKLGFIASALFIVSDNYVYLEGITTSSLAQKALLQLKKPLIQCQMSLQKDTNNLTVQAINNNKSQIANFTREYCSPLVSIDVANKIQEVTGDKSVMIFPLVIGDTKIGALVFVKKIHSDFRKEKSILRIVSKQIAIALYHSLQ